MEIVKQLPGNYWEMGPNVFRLDWQNPGDPSAGGVDLGIAANQKRIHLSIDQAGLACALFFFIKMQNGGIPKKNGLTYWRCANVGEAEVNKN